MFWFGFRATNTIQPPVHNLRTTHITNLTTNQTNQVGYKNCCFLHVSMVPTVGSEQKTKPTQHSVRQVRSGENEKTGR